MDNLNGNDPCNSLSLHRLSRLGKPTNKQFLTTSITTSYPHVGSLLALSMWTIGTMHPPIHRSNIVHWTCTCVHSLIPVDADASHYRITLNDSRFIFLVPEPYILCPWVSIWSTLGTKCRALPCTPTINLWKGSIRDGHYHVCGNEVDGAHTNTRRKINTLKSCTINTCWLWDRSPPQQ